MRDHGNVRIGIIGAGGIAQAVHLPGFQQCKHAQIAALCDESERVLRKAARDFGISSCYRDYRRMFDHADLDAVCVATPNYLHYPIVMEAADRGLHVLCEKPLALDAKQAAAMCRKVNAANVVNMVAYNYRYVPAIRFLKMLIDQGKLGRIYHFRAFYLQQWLGDGASWRTRKRRSGSGQLGDVGSHLIDFARLLVGEIAAVCSLTKIFMTKRRTPGTDRFERPDVDDAASFLAEFKRGAVGVFEVSRFAPGRGCGVNEHQSIEINAEGGSVIYDYQRPAELQLCLTKKDMAQTRFVRTPVPAAIRTFYGSSIWRAFLAKPALGFRYKQAEDFIGAVRSGDRTLQPNFADGLRTQEILDAILLAHKKRRWVKL